MKKLIVLLFISISFYAYIIKPFNNDSVYVCDAWLDCDGVLRKQLVFDSISGKYELIYLPEQCDTIFFNCNWYKIK